MQDVAVHPAFCVFYTTVTESNQGFLTKFLVSGLLYSVMSTNIMHLNRFHGVIICLSFLHLCKTVKILKH